MIRLVLVVSFLALFFLISIPVLIVERVISLFRPAFHKRPFVFSLVTSAFRCVAFLSGIRLRIIGKEHLLENVAVLYIGNHQSYFDIVITYGLMPAFTGFIAKSGMLKVPVLSSLMRYMNCLFLDRDDIRQGMQTILSAIDLINEGISVCIYPEGTRNHHPDEFLEFHKGSFKIAQRTDCPVIPVTVVNTRNIFEAHIPFIRACDVILEYGKPFRFSDLSKEDQKAIHTYTAGLIAETYRKNKTALTASSQADTG